MRELIQQGNVYITLLIKHNKDKRINSSSKMTKRNTYIQQWYK